MYEWVVALVALAAGALASVVGFGIGSILTPVLAMGVGTKVAVAAVSVPHFIGTALRFSLIAGHIDRHAFWTFGLTSAAGGLTGALLHARLGGPVLSTIFGCLLIFVAVSELSGLSKRLRFEGPAAWIAGAVSGLLGGLVGNQGGIRSGALIGLHLRRDAFIATATAVALLVDVARMPVYFFTQREAVIAIWPLVAIATAGVVAGTLGGRHLLRLIPEAWFHKLVALVIGILGIVMLAS